MNIYYDFENSGKPLPIKNPVVTTGSFDGVHVGHQAIIDSLKKSATDIDGESVLITFFPHPRKVLYPQTDGKNLFLINSQKEKIELLRKSGLDNLFIINFTEEFSKMSSVDFIRNILVGKLHSKKVIVGFNHHFGYNREGDYQYLFELGKYYNFEVEEIAEHVIKNESVSSTKIRKALTTGDIQKANACLDHYFIISGKLEKASEISRNANASTYKLLIEEEDKLIPYFGVYAVKCEFDNFSCKAIMNIKNTEGSAVKIFMELCILSEKSEDLTGKDCSVYFAKRLREQMQFSNSADFSKQLNKDIAKINELIY